jgi:hypothetical protein
VPFLKGSVTFQRFKVAGPKPGMFTDAHLERLRDRQIGRQRIASADGVETGWTAGRHIWDDDFQAIQNVYPDHLAFDFCTKVDKLPADRLKAYYATELRALSKDNPSGFPSARQKREAKEIARTRLEQEAKDGRYRKWKCVPVLWDAVTNVAFFGAAGTGSTVDRFTNLWEQTWCADLTQDAAAGKLTAVDAASLAVALYHQAEHEHLSPFVPGVTPDDRPSWCASENHPHFLGNEFLLWLWYFQDVEGDTLKAPDGSEITFMFHGGIKMECPRGVSGTGTLNSESAVRLPEAKAAARSGKLPRKAAFTLVRNGEQFSFILQAESLAVSGAKLPPPDKDDGPRAREEARLQHVRDLAEIVDQLFASFLARRMTSYWTQEVKEIAAWLKNGGKVRA